VRYLTVISAALLVICAVSCSPCTLQHKFPDGASISIVAVNDSTFFVTRTPSGAEPAQPYFSAGFRSGGSSDSEEAIPHALVPQEQDVQCKKTFTDTTSIISTGAISAVLDLKTDSLTFTLLGGQVIARESALADSELLALGDAPYGVVRADGGYYFLAARDVPGVIRAYRSLCGKAAIPSRKSLESLSYMKRDTSSREDILLRSHPKKNAEDLNRETLFSHSRFLGMQRFGAYLENAVVDTSGIFILNHLKSGLKCSVAGIPYWGIDLAADGIADSVYVASELDIRLHQMAVWAPLYCPKPGAADVSAEIAATSRIRRMLQPYIYSMAAETYFDGYTPVRPLSFDFPDDQKAATISDQFMFGDAVMVCPVYKRRARSRLVYLPSGTNWYDVFRQRFAKGGTTVVADAPLGHIPVYSRAGSIIAMISQDDVFTVVVSPGADADYTWYEDDGSTYAYESGEYSVIRFHWDDRARTLSISPRKGSHSAMVKAFPLCVRVIGLSPRILVCDGEAAEVSFGGNNG